MPDKKRDVSERFLYDSESAKSNTSLSGLYSSMRSPRGAKSPTATLAWNAVLLEGWLWKKFSRKMYGGGWHLRYFMLSGNCITYFKDARKKKVLGSVVLGTDCSVDFRENDTILVQRNRTLHRFNIFLDGPPTKTPSMKTSLQLATPNIEDARVWTNTVTQAVYGPKAAASRFQLVDSDDEGSEKEVEDRMIKFGDRIQLHARTAYDTECPIGPLSMYKKRGSKTVFIVPPAGPMVAPELHEDATFTVLDVSWDSTEDHKTQAKFGTEVHYGDRFLLGDDKGRIWHQDGHYIAPKERSSVKREVPLVFNKIGCREGDAALYGESGLMIKAMMPKGKIKAITNYKRYSSKLVGGYLNWSGQGHPIEFTVHSEFGVLKSACHFAVSIIEAEKGIVKDKNSFDNLPSGSTMDLGVLLGGYHTVKVHIEDTTEPTLSLPLPRIPTKVGTKGIIKSSHKVNNNLFLHCHWGYQSIWLSTNTTPSYEKTQWGVMWWSILLLAMWCCLRTILNGDVITAAYIVVSILAVLPVLAILHAPETLTQDSVSSLQGIHSKAAWTLSITSGTSDRSRRASLSKPKQASNQKLPPEVSEAEEEKDEKEDRDHDKEKIIVGNIPAGSTVTYADPENVVRNSYTHSHFMNFRVREGPNYKKNKKKSPSRRQLYDLISLDIVKTERKVEEFIKYIDFSPATVDELHERSERLAKSRPDLKLPPVLVIHLSWPNFAPPNPLWGKANLDGPGIVFTLTFKACDWIDDSKNDVPATKLLDTLVGSSDDSRFRNRFKILPVLVNMGECNLEGMVKSIVSKFNGRPFLSTPCHKFSDGELSQMNSKGEVVKIPYHDISIDGYLYSYLARSTTHAMLEKSSSFVIDMGFIVEAREDEEMPEQMVSHLRLNYLDANLFPEWKKDRSCSEDQIGATSPS